MGLSNIFWNLTDKALAKAADMTGTIHTAIGGFPNTELYENWRKGSSDGPLHRETGPAVIERDPITGVRIEEMWYKNGQMHREGGPAYCTRDPRTCVIVNEGMVVKWLTPQR